MAKEKIPCPLCEGGTLIKTAPKKGYGLVRLVCDQKGDNPKCKGWAHGGYQKKAGTAPGGVPVRELQHAEEGGKGGGRQRRSTDQPPAKRVPWYDRTIL